MAKRLRQPDRFPLTPKGLERNDDQAIRFLGIGPPRGLGRPADPLGDLSNVRLERNCPREGVAQERALALLMGEFANIAPLLRIHSQCVTGEAFGSLRCDCAQQLHMAMAMISKEGAGIILYEEQKGRGICLMAKLRAYQLQDEGLDTIDANERLGFKADYRDYPLPVEVLKALGIIRVRLISNNPDKVLALERAGIRVVERIPCEVNAAPFARHYLKTEKEKCGHLLASTFANIAELT